MGMIQGVGIIIVCVVILRFVLRWYFRRSRYGTSRDMHEMLRIMKQSDKMRHQAMKQAGKAKPIKVKTEKKKPKVKAQPKVTAPVKTEPIEQATEVVSDEQAEKSTQKKVPGFSLRRKKKNADIPTYANWMEEQLAEERRNKRDLDHLLDGE